MCALTTATAGLTRLLHPPVIHINCRDWLEVTDAKHTFKKLALPVVKSSLTKNLHRETNGHTSKGKSCVLFHGVVPMVTASTCDQILRSKNKLFPLNVLPLRVFSPEPTEGTLSRETTRSHCRDSV